MLDFTKKIALEPAWRKKYLWARAALYLLFLAGSVYFAFVVLFPSQLFFIDFANPIFKGNAVYNAEVSGNKLNFDAFSSENFSSAEVRLYFKNKLPGTDFGTAQARKTYKAFSYPEANKPAEFPGSGPFDNQDGKKQFADGTIISFDNAVFIVISGQAFPFKDPETFISMGYRWEDVIPVSENELGLTRSNIAFTANQPHPNGTIFATRENADYYLINNGQKQKITGSELLKNYPGVNPILADENSLDFKNSCLLKSASAGSGNLYYCSIPVADLAIFLGNDYQFEISGLPPEKPERIEVDFYRKINWLNLRDSLSKIKHGILINLGYEIKQ